MEEAKRSPEIVELAEKIRLQREAEERFRQGATERRRNERKRAKRTALFEVEFREWKANAPARARAEKEAKLKAREAKLKAKAEAKKKQAELRRLGWGKPKVQKIHRLHYRKRRVPIGTRGPLPEGQHVSSARFYLERKKVLLTLGYHSYEEYLLSPRWRWIRGKVFKLDGKRCRLCKAKADVIHHTAYFKRVLLGEDFTHLHSLCTPCHTAVEFVDAASGKRREPFDMVSEMRKRLRAAGEECTHLTATEAQQPVFVPSNIPEFVERLHQEVLAEESGSPVTATFLLRDAGDAVRAFVETLPSVPTSAPSPLHTPDTAASPCPCGQV